MKTALRQLVAFVRKQSTRAYAYRVVTGAGVIASFYGLLTAEEVALWAGLVATLFVVPAANTPRHQ